MAAEITQRKTPEAERTRMMELFPKTNIDFIGKRYIYILISGILLLSGIASMLFKGGPKWGLDFTGGAIMEVQFQNPPALDEIRKALREKQIPSFEIQTISGEGIFMIRTKPQQGSAEKAEIGRQIQSALEAAFAQRSPTILRKEYVGPTVGQHLIRQTLSAFLLTFVGIIIYVAFRFHSGVWGASGVIALIHDVLATIGIFSLLNKEITVTVVAALLTLAGYSINDTIVVFDRMREKMRLLRTEPLDAIINKSINETLSRTVITSLTVFFVVLALFFFGGEVIHDFAFALLFGVIVGTYSSIAIAAPVVYEWERICTQKR